MSMSRSNANATDSTSRVLGFDHAAAHRLRQLVQQRQPVRRPATIDALVTTFHVPAWRDAHAAETAAAITLNTAFGTRYIY